ncbi:hypothetical protein [Ancylobacter sp. IITR112]|uniref:hypothetical protein n=1 Tax=Ancylobacter sp. IITR112 TaxID=3138073 RepID=UPI003529F4DE
MRVAILSSYALATFPGLYNVALGLAAEGADVLVASRDRPEDLQPPLPKGITHTRLPRKANRKGLRALALLHGDGLSILARFQPDWIIAEHELVVTALAYKMALPFRRTRIAAFFCDYYDNRHMKFIGRLASLLDAYVDVCDLRHSWRRRDWPKLVAPGFVIRLSPVLTTPPPAVDRPPSSPRVVFTSSFHVLTSMDRDRLTRFFDRLCSRGITLDWYLYGAPNQPEATRRMVEIARGIIVHPGYRVLEQLPKAELYALLPSYDAGLHWAPVAEAENANAFWKAYFLSAASNKVGEYIAAGLAVAYAGNPGLRYLPDSLSIAFDPTDPEQGADQLADRLLDAAWLKSAKEAARRYHREEMNAEAQTAPLVRHILGQPSKA